MCCNCNCRSTWTNLQSGLKPSGFRLSLNISQWMGHVQGLLMFGHHVWAVGYVTIATSCLFVVLFLVFWSKNLADFFYVECLLLLKVSEVWCLLFWSLVSFKVLTSGFDSFSLFVFSKRKLNGSLTTKTKTFILLIFIFFITW